MHVGGFFYLFFLRFCTGDKIYCEFAKIQQKFFFLNQKIIFCAKQNNRYEMCAGLIDDLKKTPEQTMVAEIMEECGYYSHFIFIFFIFFFFWVFSKECLFSQIFFCLVQNKKSQKKWSAFYLQ